MQEASCKIGILSDSHIGIEEDHGWNQPVWIGGEESLFERLGKWRADNQVDFFIHCGDVAEPGNINRGIELLSELGCPVAAVRGNHDIFVPAQYEVWKDGLAGHPHVQFGDSVYENKLCDVILLNNQWLNSQAEPQWHWETSPVGWLSVSQRDWLDDMLNARQDRPAIVVMHYPLGVTPPYPIPAKLEQYNEQYANQLNALFDKHKRVKLVASGHFHCTTETQNGNRWHITTAAVSEAPFQVRLVEITPRKMIIKTESLYKPGDPVFPRASKCWINGDNQELAIDLT